MIERRLPISPIRSDGQSLRLELVRERLRLNEGNRWRTDPPRSVITVTSITLDLDDRMAFVDDDTAGAAVTVFLHDDPVDGQTHTIKKLGTTGTITIDGQNTAGSGNGFQIDGADTQSLASQYDVQTVLFDAEKSEWFIIGAGP